MTKLPPLDKFAAVVALARYATPLDGEDGEGGGHRDTVSTSPLSAKGLEAVEAAGQGFVNGEQDPVAARKLLFRALLDAITVGLDRPSSAADPSAATEQPTKIIQFAVAYMLSPELGDLRSRVKRLHAATKLLFQRPTVQQYAKGRWFDQSWLQAGGGVSPATGNFSKNLGSVALYPGLGASYAMWQARKRMQFEEVIADWRELFGKPDLSMETANTAELTNLAVSLGVLFMLIADEKTANWPAGRPSKVDTLASLQKVFTAWFQTGMAALSGNYFVMLNVVLTTTGHDPIPKKAQSAIEAGLDQLQSWAS